MITAIKLIFNLQLPTENFTIQFSQINLYTYIYSFETVKA